jgi:hypothetical protein
MNKIREKIWNINLVVDDIEKFPQTYKTILKELVEDGTAQTILRRKLSKLHKEGEICKTNIPGTRFGKCIFYSFKKNYTIIIEASRTGSKVYVLFSYEKVSTFYIKAEQYWILKEGAWIEKNEELVLFEGNILKII